MYKKILAMLMMVALVITTINYVPQKANAAQSDAAAYDYSDVSFIGSDNGAYTNKFKIATINDSNFQEIVNIQKPGFASKAGFYITFKSADFGTVKVNGNTATYDQQGAGLIIHVDNFTYKYNDLVVTTSSGATAGEFYVYYADGIDGEDQGGDNPGGDDPTETTTEQQGFEEGRELLPAFNTWDTYPANATSTENSVSASIPGYTGGDNWASQLVKNNITLTNGRWYVASVTLTSSVARKFQLLVQNDNGHGAANWDVNNSDNTFSVNANESYTFTTTFQATTVSNPVLFGVMMGFVDEASDACTVNVTAASLKEYSTEPTGGDEPQPVDVPVPASVAAYNFYATGSGYQIVFKPDETNPAVSYNVYMDGSDVLTTFNAEDCTQVDSKKKTVSPANIDPSVFADYADDNVHNLYLQAVDGDGNVSAKSKAGKVRVTTAATSAKPSTDPTDISRVYVVTNDATSLDTFNGNTKEQSKQDAALTIISGDGKIKNASHYGTIKLRGNSTAFADKKAYNISFNEKKSVIDGAAKGKKWCLLANAYEKTLLRNKLAMDFGAKLGGVATPANQYVDVYINGEYKGCYTLSEPADNDRSGVSYSEEDGSNDLLFELENNERDESSGGAAYYRTQRYGIRFVTEDLEDDVLALYEGGTTSIDGIANALRNNNTKFSNFVTTLNNFETAIDNTSSTSYLDYVDVDSFVDMYVINELFQVVDFGYSSVKFYVTYDGDNNPTIHAGPLWDFDLASGNSGDASCRTYDTLRGQQVNRWFKQLMLNSDFSNRVKAKFQSMQGYIQNLYQDNVLGTNEIDKNIALMGNARVRNYTSKAQGGAGWSESTADSAEYTVYRYSYSTDSPYSTYTYAQHITYLKNWLKNRNEYLVDTWGLTLDFDVDNDEITISDDLAITGYQMSSNFGGESGQIGQRTVYQIEPTVEGKTTTGGGVVYGMNTNNDLTSDNMTVDSDNNHVVHYAATSAGLLSQKMGQSATANYYAMTMVNNTNVSVGLYTTEFVVRVYAKLSDGSYAYSPIKKYTVYRIADYLYSNGLISTLSTHNYIYDKVLKYVNSDYEAKDFDWKNTIVRVNP